MGREVGLIGASGFVGTALRSRAAFDRTYRSTTIDEIRGRRFAALYCAAPSSLKFQANRDPASDRRALDLLLGALKEVQADRFILLSTIDVYPRVDAVVEDTPIDETGLRPYSLHRFLLEQFVRERFEALVVRLPGLFGDGLRKNMIFDILHRDFRFVDGEAVMQFYEVGRLWDDLQTALAAGLSLLNLATEPARMGDLAAEALGVTLPPADPDAGPHARYDMRTRHGEVFGRSGPYLLTREEVTADLARFAERFRAGPAS